MQIKRAAKKQRWPPRIREHAADSNDAGVICDQDSRFNWSSRRSIAHLQMDDPHEVRYNKDTNFDLDLTSS